MTNRIPNQSLRRRRWQGFSSAHRVLCAFLATLQILFPSLAAALPTDGNVVGGTATIQQSNPKTLDIQQATDKAILNWNSFSIAANEAVRFYQPSINSIALNRVVGVDPSVILGQLQANGRIFLINPNGILFGAGAQINVGGLLASTLQIKDGDFMAGRYLFAQDPLKALGTIINRGEIHVSDHGFVVLTAPGVANEGLIVANLGTAVLGSGQKLTLDLMGDGLINYTISDKVLSQVTGPDGKALSSAVSNTGTIQADGGQVVMTAKASGDVFSSVVNQSGVIRARSLVNYAGVVRLEGSDPVANTGTVGWQANLGKVKNADGAVLNTGTIDVSAAEPGAAQGQVTITGEKLGIAGTILAKGADGAQGGRVLISSAEKTVATSDAVVDTSGVGNSSAGNVVIWSDKDTLFGGTILVRGGALGGNGGQIEVSGHENLGFFGQVNALAPMGNIGSLLLDPRNIVVANGGGATLAQVDQFSDTPDTNQAIATATINAAAANVTLQANNDITVTDAIAMTNNGVGITMQAGRDIRVNAGISTTNGNISMTANDTSSILADRANGAAGDIRFAAGADLSSGIGNITLAIDPTTAGNYTPGSILNVRNLTTSTGNISIFSPQNATLSGTVNAGSGTVAISANAIGSGGQDFTMNAGSSITTTNTTAGAVQINVNAAGGGTGTATLRNITTGNGGTITVATDTGGNATGNDITQIGGTLLDVGAGTINLSTSTAGGRNIGTAGSNIFTNAGTISAISGTNGIFINNQTSVYLAGINTSGNFSLTTGGTVTQTGALTVAGTTSFTSTAANTDILLASQANDLTGAVSFGGTLANFRDVQLRNVNAGATVPALAGLTNLRNLTLTYDNAAVALPTLTLTAGGSLAVTAGGAITDSGNLIVLGTTTLTAGANNVTLDNANDFTGAVAVTSGNNVALNDVNALVLGASTISGTLNVTTNGALTQSGALAVTGVTTLAAGAANNITLNNAANNFSTVGITSGNNVVLTDTNALDLAASTISGTLGVTTGGTLTQSGALTVTGATTLAARATNNITLNNAANNFSTVGITSGNNVVLTDTNALDLGASTVSGTLGVTTGGTLTQSGALTVTGATTFTATAANTDVLLNTQANNFASPLSFAGTLANFRDLSLRNVNTGATVPALAGLTNLRNFTLTYDNAPIALPALTLTAGGNLNVTAGGSITETGALTVPGTTTLATTVAGSDILLNTQANNFTGAITFGGTQSNIRDVGLRNVNAGASVPSLLALTNLRNLTLTFDNAAVALPTLTLTAGGSLAVTAGGAITDTGNLVVPGTTTLTAGANNIALDNANDFTGAVAVTSGNNVTLNDINALDLGASTVSGTLGVTTNGALTQSGAVTVTGVTTLAAGAANNITLNNAANDFSTVGITSGNNVVLTDSTAVDLGAATVSGTLSVTAGGLLSQSGALAVAGAASFDTTAAATLGSVTLANGAALTLNTSTVGGHLTATTTAGDLTLPAGQTLTVVGDATLTPAGNVNLLGTTRIGGTQSAVGGTGSSFVLSADTNLNALPLPAAGNITVTTTGTTATFAGAPLLPAAMTLNNAGNTFGGPVSVTTAAPAFTGTTTNTYNLTQSAPVALNPGQGLTVTDLGGTAGTRGNLTLPNAGNSFNTVTFTGGDIVWAESGPVTIGSVSANAGATSTGALTITSTGPISQTGAITAAGLTTLAAGAANNITLNNAANDFSAVGITSGNNVALTDANALTLSASAVSGNFSANAGDLTVGGAVASSGGGLTLAGANTVTQLASLSVIGANPVTVTTAGGPITMAAAATTTSGTGGINYAAGTDVTLGSLSTGGGVNVIANGRSVLSAVGSGTNVTAGANSTLQAFNGVVGTTAAPMTVNVNPATLSVRATTAIGGISVFINGIVLPSNALTLLNVPPGLVCFNGCPVPPAQVESGSRLNFNLDSVIPSYNHEQVESSNPSLTIEGNVVAREIGPCIPKASCNPRAKTLTVTSD